MTTRILLLLTLSLGTLAAQKPEITTSLPVEQVLLGETTTLNIQIPGEQPNGPAKAVDTEGIELVQLDADFINRRIYAANIGLTAKRTGTLTAPSIAIPLRSGNQMTEDLTFESFPLDRIVWTEQTIGDQRTRLGTVILAPSGDIYEGQSIPITAKVLIPKSLPYRVSGYAEISKNNIGAWRLDPPFPPNYDQPVSPRPGNALRPRDISINNQTYQVVNFTTHAAPLKAGPVTIGPGKARSLQITVSSQKTTRGFFSSFSRSYAIELELPKLTFDALPLPAGAPADFNGAVGNFTLQTSIEEITDPKPGDPIMVEVTVAGEGNFSTLPAPELQASEAIWKTYPASRNDQLGDRRSRRGKVVFSQILRPLSNTSEIPPFGFSFFNPQTKSYQTIRSQPIPVQLSAAVATGNQAPPAGIIPIAEMTDILGLIDPKPFTTSSSPPAFLKYWQILPALLALTLITLIIKQHLPCLQNHKTERSQALDELRTVEDITESSSFLRAAANFAEKHQTTPSPFTSELIAERDQLCFQPGQSSSLKTERRQSILSELKKIAQHTSLLVLLLTLFFSPSTDASDHQLALQAWENKDYNRAKELYQNALQDGPNPDLLFNLGNTYQKLGESGLAALHYHRALTLEPNHPEALQNLAFLARLKGAPQPLLDSTPSWAQNLTVPALLTLAKIGAWLIALAILTHFALKSSPARLAFIWSLATGITLLLIAGFLFWIHPKPDPQPQPNAVIIAKNGSTLRTEASPAGSAILQTNPTTACRILATRGDWTYIELPNLSRGWIVSNALEKI
ncbi:MAG: hypothetical protein AAGC74_06920 [Verrucomicrobiota bacterium]